MHVRPPARGVTPRRRQSDDDGRRLGGTAARRAQRRSQRHLLAAPQRAVGVATAPQLQQLPAQLRAQQRHLGEADRRRDAGVETATNTSQRFKAVEFNFCFNLYKKKNSCSIYKNIFF